LAKAFSRRLRGPEEKRRGKDEQQKKERDETEGKEGRSKSGG